MQAGGVNAAVDIDPNPDPRGTRPTYSSPHAVTKIKLVKPEKVAGIENALIAAAQQGKLRNRVSEQELVGMLESQSQTETKVTVVKGLCSSSAGASTTSGDLPCVINILILMLNFKRTLKDSSNLPSQKSRSKSIYRGDQSHTLSMNLRVDHDLSPDPKLPRDPYILSHKQSYKENRSQKFRDSLKITEASHSGKKSQRDDVSRRSANKLMQAKALETDRYFKQVSNISSRKSMVSKN